MNTDRPVPRYLDLRIWPPPAHDLPHLLTLKQGAKIVEINREETVLTPYVTLPPKRGKSSKYTSKTLEGRHREYP
jgi:hypothetical protein